MLASSIAAAGQHTKLYELLGVDPAATEQQIKKAYRKSSMTWHPDKNLGNEEEAQAKFIEIGNAFETLSDSTARQQYDRHGIDKQTQQSKGGAGRSNFASFHRRFEEQMRRSGHTNFETFFNAGKNVKPKSCDRVVEGRTLSLGCEHGSTVEKVLFASYGVPAGRCGGGGGGGLAAGECHFPNTQQVIEAACLGQNQCTIRAVNENFGEPCYGTTKYLAVELACSSPPPPPSCGLVRENKVLELGCGPGRAGLATGSVITEVVYASYGVSRGGCDSGGGLGTLEAGECGDTEATTGIVQKECLGKATCVIAATNQKFGDPCFGTGKTLAVAVRCGAKHEEL
eukprot:SAG22_NODE_1111_length_5537_cov_6.209636_2_plen_341_part_00